MIDETDLDYYCEIVEKNFDLLCEESQRESLKVFIRAYLRSNPEKTIEDVKRIVDEAVLETALGETDEET
ncbi:hypothetical protein DRN75_04240 [Nanoarchaeota archaeon]|nr:MAG: hypothetical protein DRN75_04240 [Nanoarchaeota archaeon]